MNTVTQIVLRALAVSVVLGTTLTAVNQSAAVFGAAELQVLPFVLVFVTPFLVVTLSQVLGMRAARRTVSPALHAREGFLSTVFSHGIPLRAVILGIAAALINSAVMAAGLLSSGQSLAHFPQPLMLQALTLPIVFGALSQALSFRRALTSMRK